jgi:hypothetical protein
MSKIYYEFHDRHNKVSTADTISELLALVREAKPDMNASWVCLYTPSSEPRPIVLFDAAMDALKGSGVHLLRHRVVPRV